MLCDRVPPSLCHRVFLFPGRHVPCYEFSSITPQVAEFCPGQQLTLPVAVVPFHLHLADCAVVCWTAAYPVHIHLRTEFRQSEGKLPTVPHDHHSLAFTPCENLYQG